MQGLLRSRRACVGLAMLGGLLTGLTLILPRALGWLEWLVAALAVPVLWRLTEEECVNKRGWRFWCAGFAFFFPFYLVVFHWFLALYPLSFTGLPPALTAVVVAVAWLGAALLQSVGMSFVFVAVGYLWRCPLVRREPILRPILAAAVWTAAEWTQTLGWFGVPWGRLALGQAEYLPMVQTVSIFGCYGVAFLLVAVNFTLAQVILTPSGSRRALCLLASGLFLGNLAAGSVLYVVGEHRTPDGTLTVGTVQGNFSSNSKWSMTVSGTVSVYQKHIEALNEAGVDLVLLPETALPFMLQDYVKYMDRMCALAVEGEMTLFTGTFTRDDFGTEYSSVMTFHADGTVDEKIYNKRRLVPFGEFVPMRDLVTALIPPLADLNMWESDLGAGTEATVVENINGAYGFMICFDSIYENLSRDSVREGAQLLLLPTNDSWFLDSAAVYMHNNQARLRAIECGRSVVRAANTGISSLITPTGRVTAMLPPLVEGTVRGEVSLHSHATPYALFGNWIVWVSMAAASVPVWHKIVCAWRMRLDKRGKT